MACIKRPFDVSTGPLVRIGISPPGTLLSASPHKVVPAWALIDTGAEISAIFKSVAKSANVFPIGMRDMISANHAEPAGIYIVDLQVHLSEIVQIPTLEVVGFEDYGRSTFHALLGRDVLCRGKGSFFMESGVYELCL